MVTRFAACLTQPCTTPSGGKRPLGHFPWQAWLQCFYLLELSNLPYPCKEQLQVGSVDNAPQFVTGGWCKGGSPDWKLAATLSPRSSCSTSSWSDHSPHKFPSILQRDVFPHLAPPLVGDARGMSYGCITLAGESKRKLPTKKIKDVQGIINVFIFRVSLSG